MVGNKLHFLILLLLLVSLEMRLAEDKHKDEQEVIKFSDEERLTSELYSSPNINLSSSMKYIEKREIPKISAKALEEWYSLMAMNALDKDNIESNGIPDNELEPRVINGREAIQEEFPWMVALHKNGRFICSSFLIAPNLVMTAAHCVVTQNGKQPASSFYGVIGNINRNGGQRIRFTDVQVHPRYGTGTEYDIAVFTTAANVPLEGDVSTVCLPRAGRRFDYQWAQAMGWGVYQRNGGGPSEVLMTTSLPVISIPLCQAPYFLLGRVRLTGRHVCAGGFQSGICFGDSGGPLVALNESSPVAIGVASFVSFLGCAAPLVPGVYTSTSSYVDWLNQSLRGNTAGICFV